MVLMHSHVETHVHTKATQEDLAPEEKKNCRCHAQQCYSLVKIYSGWRREHQTPVYLYNVHVPINTPYTCREKSISVPNMDGALTFTHVCVDSSQTVLEHHRSFIPALSNLHVCLTSLTAKSIIHS